MQRRHRENLNLSQLMKGKLESICNDHTSNQTRASAIAPTVSENGSIDVPINGTLDGSLGVVAA
jgi:hypothetical protein